MKEEDGLVLFGGEHSIEAGRGHGFAGELSGILAIGRAGSERGWSATGMAVRLQSSRDGVEAGGRVCGGGSGCECCECRGCVLTRILNSEGRRRRW